MPISPQLPQRAITDNEVVHLEDHNAINAYLNSIVEGQPGVPRGTWDVAVAYDNPDIVTHEGSSYIARGPSTGSEPLPDNSNLDWQLLASSGSGGATTLPALTDVDDAAAPTSGHYLRGDGTDWSNSAIQDGDLPASIARDAEVTVVSDALDAHLTDTEDAHDASAISIVDAGGHFTGTDVEAALQELGAGGGGGTVGDLLDFQLVRKTANETVTSSTTLQDDDHLTLPIGANETWEFEFVLAVWGHSSGDFLASIVAPAGAAGKWHGIGPEIGVSSNVGQTNWRAETAFGSTRSYGLNSAEASFTILLKGIVRNGANAGDLKLQWAQLVAHATGTVIVADSYLVARRVA